MCADTESGPLLLYRSLDRAGHRKLRGARCAVRLHLLVERGGGESTCDLQIFRPGTCDLSRRCTHRNSPADGRSVTETTMRTVEVVMLKPGRELLIAFFGVEVVANVSPLAQGSLNEAFGLAVGARSRIRIAAVILLKFLPALAVLTLIFGMIRITYMFRARICALSLPDGASSISVPLFRMARLFFPQIKPPLPFHFLTSAGKLVTNSSPKLGDFDVF